MTEEKTTRELVYETNRDVKWICRMLRQMEAQDEEFESRLRALERLSGGEGGGRTPALDDERRGRWGRGRGGGGDRAGARRGVREIVLIRSAAVSPTGVEPSPGGTSRVDPGRRGLAGLHLCTRSHLVCTLICTRNNPVLRPFS